MTRTRLPAFIARTVLLMLAQEAWATSVTVVIHSADGQPSPNVVVELTPVNAVATRAPVSLVVVAQHDLQFVPYLTAIPVGTTVRFTNQDPFDHHLRSEPGGPSGSVPPAKEFELRLQAANGDKGASADVKFDKPGSVVLGCHLHSSMRGHLFISNAPWVTVTDTNGVATFADVPEGRAEMRTWSPEQLADQAINQSQISGSAVKLDATLNFTPPKARRHRW